MEQQLMTSELENKLKEFKLYSQEGKGKQAKVIAHYFLANMDWYVLEGNKEGEDFRFFGITDFHNDFGPEYGYFMLSDLKGTFNMPVIINGKQTTLPVMIERDEYWEEKSVDECEIF
ncbi:MAG: DUF2958 domain-containing protein [Bacilli bacterium]|nr:DUF2958 domain-containing protein [Bacilli bacterium]